MRACPLPEVLLGALVSEWRDFRLGKGGLDQNIQDDEYRA